MCNGQLGAVNRAQRQLPARLGELHCSADVVVVGERERLVTALGCGAGELVGQRGAVAERVRGMSVQLGVGHQPRCSYQRVPSGGSRKTTMSRPLASTSSK